MSKTEKIHMVGICGAGMSGLAYVMAQMGWRISGSDSDAQAKATRHKLEGKGITVFEGHDSSNVADPDLLVISAAISDDNPEVIAARQEGIEIISRGEMLGRLMNPRFGIAVTGTHGKTTTTSMLAMILETAGLDPTILIGGDLNILNGNAKMGHGDIFLAEACEAYKSFLRLKPSIAVVTNIEGEHFDCFGSMESVIEAFEQFFSQIKPSGIAIACTDCPNVRRIMTSIEQKVITYGVNDDADYRAFDIDLSTWNPTFNVSVTGRNLGKFSMNIPGIYNVRNALAAIAVAVVLNIDPEVIRDSLNDFKGADRRFEILGTVSGITIVDDYAHHPTEIQSTLEAAIACGNRVIAVFQPHLYSRTKQFADDFAESLKIADLIVLTKIYPAREKFDPDICSSAIADKINAEGIQKAVYIENKGLIPENLMSKLTPNDVVIFMGAGDIRTAGESLLEQLQKGK